MTKSEKIRRYYPVFLSVFTVAIGAAFIAAAANIYYSGRGTEEIYSREIVGGRLLYLLAPLLLYIVAVVAGYVLSCLYPGAPAARPARDVVKLFDKLKQRIPASADSALFAAYRRGERVRLAVRCACGAVCLAAAAAACVYLCDTAHFTDLEHLNGDVLRMLANVLPWVGAALAALCGGALFEAIYVKRELPAVKKMIAAGGELPRRPLAEKREAAARAIASKRTYIVAAVRIALAGAAVALIVCGALNGGARDVLIKAINICTECIGLG